MLWYDDDKTRSLAEKVAQAAEYYTGKYGNQPTACYVHPSALEETEVVENGVAILPANHVRPNHFWVGVEETWQGEKSV